MQHDKACCGLCSCASVDNCAGLELPLCAEDSLPVNIGNSSALRLFNKKVWLLLRTCRLLVRLCLWLS